MDEKSHLPGRAVENGIELFSASNELHLIREWLPNAPDQVQILRVSHRRHCYIDDEEDEIEHEDSFTISCKFDHSQPLNNAEDANRLNELWSTHIAPLDLPDLTWIGNREISLSWHPDDLTPKYRDEFPTHERARFDFDYQTEQALVIWKVLHGPNPDELARYLGGPYHCKFNLFKLGPDDSADDLEFTQEELDHSILDDSDIWIYLLAQLKQSGVDAPLLDRFQNTFDRLKAHPDLPDLSCLADPWDPVKAEVPDLSPEDQERAAKTIQITISELDALLTPSLTEINDLLMPLTEPEDYEESEDDTENPEDEPDDDDSEAETEDDDPDEEPEGNDRPPRF